MRPLRCLLLFLALVTSAHAEGGPAALPVDPVADQYVRPHQRIDVGGGRRMNLFCQGKGSPTVIFDSGLSDWSSTWALIQPAVATRTRACSYDRAGMGYSDQAKHRHSPFDSVDDLQTLLRHAGIKDPLVLVGHSLGGFNMKLYAALHPRQVAGLVLVDPAEERIGPRLSDRLTARFGAELTAGSVRDDIDSIAQAVTHFRECADLTRRGALDEAAYTRCTDPVRAQLGPTILAERKRLQATVDYQETQAAEIAASMYVPDAAADARYAKLFSGVHPLGDRPVLVLTHSIYDMTPPFGDIGYVAWVEAHRNTASLSSRGEQRMVPTSRHNIQVDHPQVVIDAVTEVLDQLRRK